MTIVSIIIAVLNAEEVVRLCLESIVAQSYKGWEIVVIDGGSMDGTIGILKQFSKRISYWISEPDRSVFDAWNKALPHIKGDWVVFLGADDVLADRTTLERAAGKLEQAALDGISLVYGQVDFVDRATGDVIEKYGRGRWPESKRRQANYMPFCHTGLFQRSSLFARFGPFDSSYRVSGDHEFLLRILKHPDIEARQISLLVARMSAGGLSSNPRTRMLGAFETLRARKTHRLGLPPLGLIGHLTRSMTIFTIYAIFGRRTLLVATNLYRSSIGKRRRKSH